jgi:hypothetical protein
MSSLRGDAGEKQGSLGRDEELHAALLVAPTAGKADDAHVLASHSAVENAPRISYVGATPTAQAYLCAALLINVGAAAGYVVANTARSVLAHHLLFTDGLYVLLATAFAVDALLYLLSWHGARPPPSRAATAAECLNIAPSLGYVVTASLYPWEPGDPELTGAVMIAEVVFSVVFLIDASLYLGVWWSDLADAAPRDVSRESSEDSPTESAAESELSAQGWEEGAWRLGRPLAPLRRRPSAIAARRRRWSRYAAQRWPRCWLALHDLEGAGQALNLLGSLLYVVGSTVGAMLHFRAPQGAGNGPVRRPDVPEPLRVMARVNVLGDALFLLSSLAFLGAWARQSRELERVRRRGDAEQCDKEAGGSEAGGPAVEVPGSGACQV